MLLQEFGGANAVAYCITTKIKRWVLHLFCASDYNEGFCCYCVSFSWMVYLEFPVYAFDYFFGYFFFFQPSIYWSNFGTFSYFVIGYLLDLNVYVLFLAILSNFFCILNFDISQYDSHTTALHISNYWYQFLNLIIVWMLMIFLFCGRV